MKYTQRLICQLLYLLILVCLVSAVSCRKGGTVIEEPNPIVTPEPTETCNFISFKIDGALCAFDAASKTFFYPISVNQGDFSPLIEVAESAVDIKFNEQSIVNDAVNDLGAIEINEPISVQFILCDASSLSFQLVFTQLPIIQINTAGQVIKDEPKIAATFLLNDPEPEDADPSKRITESIIGIEVRGGSSQSYDKKAYALELWENEIGAETVEEKLLDIRKDDDWILDGMSNDISRMRNRVAMDVWRDFSKLPYLLEEPKANNGTTGKLVELFIDEEYRGIYALSDRIDRKLLKLQKFEAGSNFGVLYKSFAWGRGVVTYKNYYDFDNTSPTWEGWEQKYPDPEKEGIFWEPIADFTKFAVTASDEDFISEISDYLDLANAVDYYIFLNLIRGDDNTGKNMYMAKYNQDSPFLMIPWDVDATWGLFWDRTRTNPNDIILSNHLFNRLLRLNPNGFRSMLKDRWQDARNGIFTQSDIRAYFDNYAQQMIENGAYARESTKWEIEPNLENELLFIDNWIEERLAFLDDYFDNL